MQLWIAEHLDNEYIVGVFTTFERAQAESNRIALREGFEPRWEPPHAEDEQLQWLGYHGERMAFYITRRYLNNEVD